MGLHVCCGARFITQHLSFTRDEVNAETISIAKNLLLIVTAYLFFDAIQVILSGALRGAGDTWFVLITVLTASVIVITLGSWLYEPITSRNLISPLHYWWVVMCVWIWSLGTSLFIRYRHGKWREMRMIDNVPIH